MENALTGREPRQTRDTHRRSARVQESFLARAEKAALLSLAARMPAWVNSDHLTLLGLFALVATGATYWLSRWNRSLKIDWLSTCSGSPLAS